MTKILILIAFVVFAFQSSFAQVYTSDVDLTSRSLVPLYDCSIFGDSYDRSTCFDLKNHSDYRFENRGYAADCYRMGRHDRENCLQLADRISRDPNLIDCDHMYDRVSERQCELTKRAFERGRFENESRTTTYMSSGPGYSSSTTTTRNSGFGYNSTSSVTTSSSTLVTNGPVIEDVHAVNTCGPEAYDRALARWRIKNEEQKKRGRTRSIIGVGALIGGMILGGSNDRTTRTIGGVLQIGGGVMLALGLVDLASADIILPYSLPGCTQYYVTEQRMVTVDQQECVSTQYTENHWNSSRSYYEVNCSSHRYVTFEEFQPWNEGRPYRGY